MIKRFWLHYFCTNTSLINWTKSYFFVTSYLTSWPPPCHCRPRFSWPSDLPVIVGLDLLDQLTSEPLLASFYITCWPPSLCRSRFTWAAGLRAPDVLVLPEQLFDKLWSGQAIPVAMAQGTKWAIATGHHDTIVTVGTNTGLGTVSQDFRPLFLGSKTLPGPQMKRFKRLHELFCLTQKYSIAKYEFFTKQRVGNLATLLLFILCPELQLLSKFIFVVVYSHWK